VNGISFIFLGPDKVGELITAADIACSIRAVLLIVLQFNLIASAIRQQTLLTFEEQD
jgi:hypothetical protein